MSDAVADGTEKPEPLNYERRTCGHGGYIYLFLWSLSGFSLGWSLWILLKGNCFSSRLAHLVELSAVPVFWILEATGAEKHGDHDFLVPVMVFCILFSLEWAMLGAIAGIAVRLTTSTFRRRW